MKRALWLAEEVFELGFQVGFFVAVFDDYGGVEGNAPVFALAFGDGAGTGYDYRFFGDDQGLVVGGGVDQAADQVVDGGGAV